MADAESPTFRWRRVTLEPGHEIDYVAADWRRALVVVRRGEIEVETRAGACGRFVRGDMLWFDGLDLARVRNPGQAPAVLLAVSPSSQACEAGFSRST
jgi:quercetin dioxygenase-like cupin family protein